MKRHKEKKALKLNIGDGCPADFVDIEPGLKFRYKDNSVLEMRCAYYFGQIAASDRGKFMDEAYRVLVPGGKIVLITPYWSSFRSVMDYRYQWPPVCEQSYLYFNKAWRESQHVNWCKCDFEYPFVYGYQTDPEISTRTQEVQADRIKHQINAVLDLHVTMVKK